MRHSICGMFLVRYRGLPLCIVLRGSKQSWEKYRLEAFARNMRTFWEDYSLVYYCPRTRLYLWSHSIGCQSLHKKRQAKARSITSPQHLTQSMLYSHTHDSPLGDLSWHRALSLADTPSTPSSSILSATASLVLSLHGNRSFKAIL